MAAVAAVEEEAAVVGEVVEEGLDLRPGAAHEEGIMTMAGPQVVIPPHCGQSWRPGISRWGSLTPWHPGGITLRALKGVAVGLDLSVDEGCVLTVLILEC